MLRLIALLLIIPLLDALLLVVLTGIVGGSSWSSRWS